MDTNSYLRQLMHCDTMGCSEMLCDSVNVCYNSAAARAVLVCQFYPSNKKLF